MRGPEESQLGISGEIIGVEGGMGGLQKMEGFARVQESGG